MNKSKPVIFALPLIAVILAVGIIPIDTFSTNQNSQPTSLESFYWSGTYQVTLKDWNQNIISQQEFENQVTNEGLECVQDQIFGTTECVGEILGGFQWISIGTSTVPPVEGDTALGAESATCGRVQDASPTMNTVTSGQRTVQLSAIFTGAGCVGEIYGEIGLHDNSTGSNMFSTSLLPNTVQLFNASDTLTITYSLQNNS